MPANVERDDTEWTVVRELAKAGFVNFAEPCIPECHKAGYGSSPPTPQSVCHERPHSSTLFHSKAPLTTNVCTVYTARTRDLSEAASLIE